MFLDGLDNVATTASVPHKVTSKLALTPHGITMSPLYAALAFPRAGMAPSLAVLRLLCDAGADPRRCLVAGTSAGPTVSAPAVLARFHPTAVDVGCVLLAAMELPRLDAEQRFCWAKLARLHKMAEGACTRNVRKWGPLTWDIMRLVGTCFTQHAPLAVCERWMAERSRQPCPVVKRRRV